MPRERAADVAFRVVRRDPYSNRQSVVLATDDGIEAEAFVIDLRKRERQTNRTWDHSLRILGYDPTHTDDGNGCCRTCDMPLTNGCYGSHLPCGFDKQGRALVSIIEDWRAAQMSHDTSSSTDAPKSVHVGPGSDVRHTDGR